MCDKKENKRKYTMRFLRGKWGWGETMLTRMMGCTGMYWAATWVYWAALGCTGL